MSVKTVVGEDFLLNTNTARRLYQSYAEPLPIIDYHCHLDPKRIAENKGFTSITDLFLGGDHYKWRAMRSFGVPEELITGDCDPKEKFRAYAKTVSYAIGNPLYHWTALELKRYFDVDVALNEATADAIYDATLPLFKKEEYTPRGFISRSNVETVCTTDDPADSLEYHEAIERSGFGVKVVPAFRPDRCVNIRKTDFRDYIAKLGADGYDGLKRILSGSMDRFAAHGCRLSDHGLDYIPENTKESPSAAFDKAMAGGELTDAEENAYVYDMMIFLASEYARRGWCMQLHVGALRNVNSTAFGRMGPDSGYDCIDDTRLARPLARFADELDASGALPKTVLYSLNPGDLYILGTLMGCFQKGPSRSRIQLGAAWWFNDHRDGIEAHLKALADLGVLGTFVGMLTDSRSFASYPRHEYFRRILCDLIGGWVERGEYPDDEETLGAIISGICYGNAKEYFGF
ncbi:MAG: glucuronate isomerase [Clostridia bacterium]|nr:glucuronate isomerase [Clostridia bacterium]